MTATLPNFFVIGAAKSGTTSLYHYLSQHPDVYMSPNKEPHWFSRVQVVPGQGSHPVTSEEEYLRLFAGRSRESAAGEASPSYIWDARAPYRIGEVVPQARIIAILRHPVERAYSHYLMNVRDEKENLSFMEALRRDSEEGTKAWSVSRLYIDLGFYAEQLRRYYDVFDGGRIRVFLYEDLRRDPRAVLESMLKFLEVDPGYAASIHTERRSNKYSTLRQGPIKSVFQSRLFKSRTSSALRARLMPNPQLRARIRESLFFKGDSKPAMEAHAVRFLMDLYRPDIQALQDLLNRDLGHWLRMGDGEHGSNSGDRFQTEEQQR